MGENTVTQWRIDSPQSLDLEGVRRLNVRMVAGSIDVVGSSEAAGNGGAHLEISQLEGALTVTLEGDTLTISHEKLSCSRPKCPNAAVLR